jgi:hypothetical protein
MIVNLKGADSIDKLTKILEVAFSTLSFEDNMEGFVANVVLQPNKNTDIANKLTFVPSKYIIINQTGKGLIQRGGAWNKESLSLKVSPINYTLEKELDSNGNLVDVTLKPVAENVSAAILFLK